MVDAQFDADCNAALPVVMNRAKLTDILDECNSENIGFHLCALIASFAMNKDDILCRYQQTEEILSGISNIEELKTSKYKVGKHDIIDYVYEWETISKICDGKDITENYSATQEIWQESRQLLFHYGDYRECLKKIWVLVWYKFREYAVHQMSMGFEVKCTVIYAILLYFIDNAMVCKDIDVFFSPDDVDYIGVDEEIWRDAYNDSKKYPLIRNILRKINTWDCVHICLYNWDVIEFEEILSNCLFSKLRKSVKQVQNFCDLMKRNDYFCNHFSEEEWISRSPDIYNNVWKNIWKQIDVRVDTVKLDIVYDLMVFHLTKCREYWNEECGHYYGQWPKQEFNASFFVLNEICPVILYRWRIFGLNGEKERSKVLEMLKEKYSKNVAKNENIMVASFGLLLKSIAQIVWILDQPKCTNPAQSLADIETYRIDKYSKNYRSKQLYCKKNAFRQRFRKHDAKSSGKRMQNKMKKYKVNYLEC